MQLAVKQHVWRYAELRTVLLLLVCMAKNAVWALEQPANSLLERSPRFDWLVNHVAFVSQLRWLSILCVAFESIHYSYIILSVFPWGVAQVHVQRFWMQLHGSPTPKPTLLYSCMREIGMLDLGVLSKQEKEKRTEKKLTRYFHYVWLFFCPLQFHWENMK